MGKILKNRYELLTELGRGGMSTVYLARDLNLGSYWAVKHMKNNASSELFAFKKEAELLAGLSHPDIPRIVDRIEDFDDYYVVMDFVDGVSLGKKIVSEGPVSEADLINWAKMLCSILQYLHTVHDDPIIYRDMKPDNIILTQSGRVKLIDFGIAKECKHGMRDDGECYGTRGYAAPEQYKSGSNILDERTDIYSLGCTMFYLVTGKVPGKAPNACPPVRTINSDLSDGIQFIISKATMDDPKDRYQDTNEMLEDLEHIAELSSEYRETMRKRILVFSICFIMSIVFGAISVWGYFRMKTEAANNYQVAYTNAFYMERSGNYTGAADSYARAITYYDKDYNTYVKLFNALLPHDDEEEFQEKTKLAIDRMCGSYIDNSGSYMYNDPRLMYIVGKKCIEVNEISYLTKAADYFEAIKDSDMYKNGDYAFPNLDQYIVISQAMANTIDSQDFVSFSKALDELEKNTVNGQLAAEDVLQNYYTLILMYSTYPTDLSNSYDHMQELGMRAYDLIVQNMDNENFNFNSSFSLYKMLAIGNYNAGLTATDDNMATYFNRSLEWFDRIEALYTINDNETLIKKANCYEKLFKYYNKGNDVGVVAEDSLPLLENAMKIYEDITLKDPDYMLCRIKRGIAYIEYAHATNDEEHIAYAKSYYHELVNEINNASVELSTTEAYQFSSLTDLANLYGYDS